MLRCRFLRNRIGKPINPTQEPLLTFRFCGSLLLKDFIEMQTLFAFTLFEKDRAEVVPQAADVTFYLSGAI